MREALLIWESARRLMTRLTAVGRASFDWLLATCWPLYSFAIGRLSTKGANLLGDTTNPTVIVIVGAAVTSRSVRGQDLVRVLEIWARERLSDDIRRETPESLLALPGVDRNGAVLMGSYDFLLDTLQQGFWGVLRAIRLARWVGRRGLQLHLVVPDTFWVRLNYLVEIIHLYAAGSKIVLQNSRQEAEKYGLHNVCSPLFWNFPLGVIEEWAIGRQWRERRNHFLVASWASHNTRKTILEPFVEKLKSEAHEVRFSDHSLTWENYIREAADVRYVVTTCALQDSFKIGPRYYKNLLPDSAITGRVWEAFAAGALLICDGSNFLTQLGFIAGEHFLNLPVEADDRWLPSPDSCEKIAERGHLRFMELISSESKSFSTCTL